MTEDVAELGAVDRGEACVWGHSGSFAETRRDHYLMFGTLLAVRIAPLVRRSLAGLLAVGLLACAAARPPERTAAGPDASASSAVKAPLAGGPAAGDCERVGDCEACAASSACRWCTEPRACVSEGAPCTGLMLSIPRTCENDPVIRAEQERRYQEQRDARRTEKLTAEGPPIVGHLESFPGVDLPIARGKCFLAVVRLAKGSLLGRVRLHNEMRTRDESATAGSTMAMPKDPPSGLACPRTPGKLSVYYTDHDTWARVSKAGTGEVSVQFFSMPISEAELRAGDQRAADLLRRIDRMPAGCDDCDFDCRSIGGDCERRCFVDFRDRGERTNCENGCKQITRACQRGCEARCQAR